MWIGAGRTGFDLITAESYGPTFYCAAYTVPRREGIDQWRRKIKTSSVPAKNPPFTAIKSTSYIENCMAALDAESDGFHQVCCRKSPASHSND